MHGQNRLDACLPTLPCPVNIVGEVHYGPSLVRWPSARSLVVQAVGRPAHHDGRMSTYLYELDAEQSGIKTLEINVDGSEVWTRALPGP